MANVKFLGIGLTQGETQLRPKTAVETTTMELATVTAGKMFVKIEDEDPNKPNLIGMVFNGEEVDARKNEKRFGTNTDDGTGIYAFDVPMRFVEVAEKPVTFTIEFMAGRIEDGQFIIEEVSEVYNLTVTQDAAKPGDYVPD